MRLTRDEKEQIADLLEKWGKKGSRVQYHDYGICMNLSPHFQKGLSRSVKIISDYAKGWDKYSGDRAFPVPHKSIGPCDAYEHLDNLWVGQYGKDRRELCRYIAAKLRKELNRSKK